MDDQAHLVRRLFATMSSTSLLPLAPSSREARCAAPVLLRMNPRLEPGADTSGGIKPKPLFILPCSADGKVGACTGADTVRLKEREFAASGPALDVKFGS